LSAGPVGQGRIERWLIERWYSPAPVPWLRPLEGVFRLLAGIRRWFYRSGVLKVHRPGVPVLVVGNISVGGTGKTPLVLYLARALKTRGIRVGIVSRGYGGTGELQQVTPQSVAARVGDEPLLLSRRSGVPVWIGRDRVAAANALVAQGVQCIISDDGLQHYRLGRQAEIAVLDSTRGLGNRACLPAGPLREPATRLASVDLVVGNGGPVEGVPGSLTMQLQPGEAQSVTGLEPARSLRSFSGKTVHAIAGIGNPERFFDVLRRQEIRILPSPKPDHAKLSPSDLEFDDEHEILMTEKDAVKCGGFADARSWYVPVTAVFSESDAASIDKLMDALCEQIPGGD
jgi:tetraacyldisaccharide 4'-kinase